MMRFELGLERPDADRAWKSALTIAGAYIVGGIIPLSAYLFLSNAQSALKLSVIVTLIALALFGGIKGKVTGVPVFRGALQTTFHRRARRRSRIWHCAFDLMRPTRNNSTDAS
jgi:VIT1/CCC1 family predicted Fe2+/Mn2+ transporter